MQPQHSGPEPLTDVERQRLDELNAKKVSEVTVSELFECFELRQRDNFHKFMTSKA